MKGKGVKGGGGDGQSSVLWMKLIPYTVKLDAVVSAKNQLPVRSVRGLVRDAAGDDDDDDDDALMRRWLLRQKQT